MLGRVTTFTVLNHGSGLFLFFLCVIGITNYEYQVHLDVGITLEDQVNIYPTGAAGIKPTNFASQSAGLLYHRGRAVLLGENKKKLLPNSQITINTIVKKLLKQTYSQNVI